MSDSLFEKPSRFDGLPPYPFPRLRGLLNGIEPGQPPIDMTIGEPKHPFPKFVADILDEKRAGYGKYPPAAGLPALGDAIAGWLSRRFDLPEGTIDPARHLVHLNGTREGLFQAPMAVLPEPMAGEPPLVLIPNPFYQPYAGAAIAAGATPYFVPATENTGFLPDIAALPDAVLARAQFAFVCNPANPQGAVAPAEKLREWVALARKHDFIIAFDECYSEVYTDVPPPGGLTAALAHDGSLDNVLVFHSLSKRSNLPGLRSGFVAGDARAIARFKTMRAYGGAPNPLPVWEAAAAAWADEQHVVDSRALYAEKFEIADRLLAGKYNYARPAGGFCLWLNVGEGEAAARKLWAEAGLRVLPGAYLAATAADGSNPGAEYVRLALVHDSATVEAGLARLVATLGA
ncbi:MAG: aminotransferase class I/II-fold pyridoxal phosphate-dependent enzyme [Alphaproteobacteria bacterium]